MFLTKRTRNKNSKMQVLKSKLAFLSFFLAKIYLKNINFLLKTAKLSIVKKNISIIIRRI